MRTRSLLAGLLVATLSTLGVVAVAAPANAAVVSAGDWDSLATELSLSTNLTTVVTLTATIDGTGAELGVPQTATIDLAGNDLLAGSLRLSPGVTLQLVDTVGGGLLTADASSGSYNAGIHTTGATLLLAGADVAARGGTLAAAIGSEQGDADAGTITISDGDVTATASEFGAGIGGGADSAAGTISITGGTVNAEGGRSAAIGSGQYSESASGSVSISGGTVTATTRTNTGGAAIGAGAYGTIPSITISGGSVTATVGPGSQGAAIGVGGQDPGPTIEGATIAISGGTVVATASDAGAAIGGGAHAHAGSITISGTANVTAYSGAYGAAIGSGYQGLTASVTITGGTVDADSTSVDLIYGAAIGGGFQSGAPTITISGGTVTANTDNGTTDTYGAAIGSGSSGASASITISAGTVTATGGFTGAGIGGGGGSGSGVILISGGTVDADSVQWGASIGSGINHVVDTITISGGTVTARGSYFGAGIGGGYGGYGGTINLNGGTIEAHQIYNGAAIGGGAIANGGTVTIGAGATVTAISDAGSSPMSVVGPGESGVSAGSLTVSGTLIVGTASTLSAAAGQTITVQTGGVIRGAGSVTGTGTFANHGSIQNTTVTANVTDHNYLVTFVPNRAAAVPAVSSDVRVYAATFADGDRALAAYASSSADWSLGGWSTTSTGPADFELTTGLTASRTLYGVWEPYALAISPMFSTVTSGDTVTFSTEGVDQFGDGLGDVTASTSFTTDSPDTLVGSSITFLAAGVYTVTARIGGSATIAYVTVNPGPLDHLVISPDADSVVAGNNTVFSVEGYDIGGNDLGDYTADVLWSSSEADIHTLSDFYFQSPLGIRDITATLGSISDSTTMTVLGGDVAYLQISPVNPSLDAGDSEAFTVNGFDVYDNDLGIYNSLVTFTGATFAGATGTFNTAGDITVRATLTSDTSIYIETTVTVAHGPAAWVNIYTNDTGLVAGDSATFYVDVQDSHGNGFDPTGLVTFTSDEATDTQSGNVFGFTKSGDHYIHALINGLDDYVVVPVAPGDPEYLEVLPVTAGSVVAGTTRAFEASAYDEYDNLIGDVTADSTFSSSNATDVAGAPEDFYFTIAGSRQIGAQLTANASVTGAFTAVVVGDTLHPDTMTITASSTTVDQFGTVTITISGLDEWGNPISGIESFATITSSVPTDIITGNSISFPHASPHVITATLNGTSATLLIEVRAAALSRGGDESASLMPLALLMLVLGAALVANRRRRLV